MGNHRLLTNIYQNADRVEFTNRDRLVFFSDVHRGNNTWADGFAHNETIYLCALNYYYNNHFTYIEVGDGDELLKFKYIEPIRLAHEEVFRLLQKLHRKQRLYYIFGNHDNEYRNPELVHRKLNHIFNRVTEEKEVLFDDFTAHEGLVFKHKESGLEFFAVHGHQADTTFHRMIWLNGILLRLLWRPLQLLGLQDPSSASQDINKVQRVEEVLIKWAEEHHQPIIAGHTHRAHFPKKGKAPYFNIGSCVHPRWITCIEIEKGRIALIRWHIVPNKKGHLVVTRDVQKGFKHLEQFGEFSFIPDSNIEDDY